MLALRACRLARRLTDRSVVPLNSGLDRVPMLRARLEARGLLPSRLPQPSRRTVNAGPRSVDHHTPRRPRLVACANVLDFSNDAIKLRMNRGVKHEAIQYPFWPRWQFSDFVAQSMYSI